MIKREIKKLRGQLLLLGIVLTGAAVLAGGIVVARPFFERHMKEKYADLPPAHRPLIEQAVAGNISAERWRQTPLETRLLFYDQWIKGPDRPASWAQTLVRLDAQTYVARVERSLVNGDSSQRELALEFLNAGQVPREQGRQMLHRVREWATRRRLSDVAQRMQRAIEEYPEFPTTAPTTAPVS